MKTTKKIFAAVLAVMMIALMIPFSASAAETDTYNAFIKGKNGFKVNVYKVATINTTGEYTEIRVAQLLQQLSRLGKMHQVTIQRLFSLLAKMQHLQMQTARVTTHSLLTKMFTTSVQVKQVFTMLRLQASLLKQA